MMKVYNILTKYVNLVLTNTHINVNTIPPV